MKISLNLVRQLTGLPLDNIEEVTDKINRNLGGIEEVTDLGKKYKDAKIVKVVECEKHPNADKLSICKIDAGQVELIQVVCGAPNVRKDMWAVWLPPESVVPATYGTNDPFKLESREIRGVLSNGMLAAGDELGINNDHDGLLELDNFTFFRRKNSDEVDHVDALNNFENKETLTAGESFAERYGLNDVIIDIENKMFTHRPDCFGVIGVSREISGIYGQKFNEEDWYWKFPKFETAEGLTLEVINEVPELAPRFMAVAIKDVEVKPSPIWLQCALVRLGGKPINNIVDVTNYVMLLTGQPTHAYDYDKLRGHKLGVRTAKSGEKVKLLNDKTYELDEKDIVIVDADGPVGLAGVMGGGESEVSSETKNIVLECAIFDMYTIRKMSMKYGLFTDAVTRFTKGPSSAQNDRVLNELITMITGQSNAIQASNVFDIYEPKTQEKDLDKFSNGVKVTLKFVNDRLGLSLSIEEFCQLLRNVSFACIVTEGSDEIEVGVPFYRTDIEIPEDIVEEVGRLYGFDNLPLELPSRKMSPTPVNNSVKSKRLIRQRLKELGANEVLTYSFVHNNLLKKAEQNSDEAFSLSNALSPDLQFLRLSVLPSLLDKVHPNIKSGHDEFLIYEIGKGHNKTRHQNNDDGLPTEMEFLDMVYTSKKSGQGSAFYKIRKTVDELVRPFGYELVYKPADSELNFPITAPFDLDRSAMVTTKQGDFVGIIGELKSSVVKNFKLPEYTASASLDMEVLKKIIVSPVNNYQPLPKYPTSYQDICFEIEKSLTYADLSDKLEAIISSSSDNFIINWHPIDIYGEENNSNKRVTFRLVFTNYERTMTDQEINKVMDQISVDMQAGINAQRV